MGPLMNGSTHVSIQKPSPNFDGRGNHDITHTIIHYTECDLNLSLSILCENSANPVSAHYVIDRDGTIYQLVCESMRAWHGGASFWKGIESLNKCSIGIELVNLGNEPFPNAQIESLIRLCQDLKDRLSIKPENFIGHSDIAPQRKKDPGNHFPWETLANQGIGLDWRTLKNKNQHKDPLKALEHLGYDIRPSQDPEGYINIIKAFQSHFVPEERQDPLKFGILTPLTLTRLLEMDL